jgi:hypothetical protein
MTTQDNINKAIKIYNSCSSKFTNLLPWSLPIPERISIAIDLIKQSILDYKIQKDVENQIKYSMLIDNYYDEYYKHSHDRLCKSSQTINLKELIQLCIKENKKNIIININNNDDVTYDIFNFIKKYINIAEETGEEYTMLSCYKFLLEFYKNPSTNIEIDFVIDIYEKMRNIKEVYEESYADLLVSQKGNYKRAAGIYEEIAKNRIDKPTKFSIDTLLLKAFICYLCVDDILAERKLDEYEINYPIITNTLKFKFCSNIMTEYKNKNIVSYISVIRDYDSIKQLDDYMINLLNKIKKNMTIEEEEEDLC